MAVALPILALVATVGSGAMAAVSSREQGIAVQREDRAKANAAALQAGQQQIAMRQKMLAGLAAQRANTLGAIGTGGPSSFGANTMRQITQAQNDLLVNKANESAQVSLLDQQGANAAAAGTANAVGDVLGTAGKITQGGGNSMASQAGL